MGYACVCVGGLVGDLGYFGDDPSSSKRHGCPQLSKAAYGQSWAELPTVLQAWSCQSSRGFEVWEAKECGTHNINVHHNEVVFEHVLHMATSIGASCCSLLETVNVMPVPGRVMGYIVFGAARCRLEVVKPVRIRYYAAASSQEIIAYSPPNGTSRRLHARMFYFLDTLNRQ